MVPESMEGYKKYGDISDHSLRRYLSKSARNWSYAHCGAYIIYFKPCKEQTKHEVLAVVECDNVQCTKTILIPNGKVAFFEEVVK